MTKDSKPTVCLPGLNTHDQLFLWHLSRLPLPYEIGEPRLAAACERCRYPLARARELQTGYPRAWARMLQKRRCWLTGEPDPLGDATPRRVANARRTDLLCRHRRMAERIRKAGWLP
jgi:hypothetical protein